MTKQKQREVDKSNYDFVWNLTDQMFVASCQVAVFARLIGTKV